MADKANDIPVFLFTFALFLSGYVLQQKTVNDIRAAIKPQIAPLRPDLILPPKFREGEFWDGTAQVVVVNAASTNPETSQPKQKEIKENEQVGDDMIGATRWQKAAKLKEKERLQTDAEAKRKMTQETKGGSQDSKTGEVEEKPLSRAERRKKIKEEILAAGEGEGYKGYRRRMW